MAFKQRSSIKSLCSGSPAKNLSPLNNYENPETVIDKSGSKIAEGIAAGASAMVKNAVPKKKKKEDEEDKKESSPFERNMEDRNMEGVEKLTGKVDTSDKKPDPKKAPGAKINKVVLAKKEIKTDGKEVVVTAKKLTPAEAKKQAAKRKIREGRSEKKSARKEVRKDKRNKRVDKQIKKQTRKGKEALEEGKTKKAGVKAKRLASLKARKKRIND
mgnify:CR=1 FL=1